MLCPNDKVIINIHVKVFMGVLYGQLHENLRSTSSDEVVYSNNVINIILMTQHVTLATRSLSVLMLYIYY